MVNFHDYSVIAQDTLVAAKLWHTMGGFYIWEFLTTLGYELGVIRGLRPYRWTIWVYSLARFSALLMTIFAFVLVGNLGPINCKVTVSLMSTFAFLATFSSSLLIVLRIIAIWNRNKVAIATAISVWVINAIFFLQGVVRLRYVWSAAQVACVRVDMETRAFALIAIPLTDIALLLIMFIGLFRMRLAGGGMIGLVHLLWRQGVIWLFLAFVAELPPVVFIALNLNDPFNIMFQPPSWITMVIAGTRMHRYLVDFASSPNHDLQFSSPPVLETRRRNNTVSIPMNTVEVDVHIVSEQYGATQMRDDTSSISTDEHAREVPKGEQ